MRWEGHRQRASEVRSGVRRVTADEVGMAMENSSKSEVARIIRPLKETQTISLGAGGGSCRGDEENRARCAL